MADLDAQGPRGASEALTVGRVNFGPRDPMRNCLWRHEVNTKPVSGADLRQEGGTHYQDMQIEPWDVIDTWPGEQRIGAYRAGALKYLMRMGAKDARLLEARKAQHYAEKLAEVLSEIAATPDEERGA